jgi:hypothetical protein
MCLGVGDGDRRQLDIVVGIKAGNFVLEVGPRWYTVASVHEDVKYP